MQSRRMFENVTLRVKDISRSREFYQAITETLGFTISSERPDSIHINELKITQNDEPSHSVHLAFVADSPGAVKLFHETALKMGGTCKQKPNTVPMDREKYKASVLDPDGNVIEVVYRLRPKVF